MKRWLPILVALLTSGLLSHAEPARERPVSFDERFPLLRKRNIFDPSRHASRPQTAPVAMPAAPQAPPPAPASRESLGLLGVARTSHGVFAHFSGSDPAYACVLQKGGIVAGFTVVRVSLSGVELESDGSTLSLPVGRRLGRDASGGAWVLEAASAPAPPPPPVSPSTPAIAGVPSVAGATNGPASSVSAGAPPSGGVMSDVIKRLMERRRKELSR